MDFYIDSPLCDKFGNSKFKKKLSKDFKGEKVNIKPINPPKKRTRLSRKKRRVR